MPHPAPLVLTPVKEKREWGERETLFFRQHYRLLEIHTKRASYLKYFNLLSKQEGQTRLSSLVTSTPILITLPTLSSLVALGYVTSTARNSVRTLSTSHGESRNTRSTTSLFLKRCRQQQHAPFQHRYTKVTPPPLNFLRYNQSHSLTLTVSLFPSLPFSPLPFFNVLIG